MKVLSPEEFMAEAAFTPIVDVRSSSEYFAGHIPGSVNIAILDNDDRRVVGTLYRQLGRDKAVEKGLELVGPKAPEMLKLARETARDNRLAVYCWRGGMRSRNMAMLFGMGGIECTLLEGGYKAYRAYSRAMFTSLKKPLVLAGATGSGKTEVLRELAAKGEQVLDLEGLACHKGSVFGSYGQQPQPGTEHFHNLVSAVLQGFDKGKRIWMESESMDIGEVSLPQGLWERMNEALVIELEVNAELRLERLWNEYGSMPVAEVEKAVRRISQGLGGQHVKTALEMLERGESKELAKLLLAYYDKKYEYSRDRHRKGRLHKVQVKNNNPADIAGMLITEANLLGI